MQIILSKYIGFCKGVERSVDIALNERKKNNFVYTNHPLIHNKYFVRELEENGIYVADPDDLKSGETLVISAHGASEKAKENLKNKGINVIDATCPFVKKIHEIIAEKYSLGYKIIVFGDKNHAEIKSITEDFPDCLIVGSEEEIDFSDEKPYFILTQTTFNVAKIDNIKIKIKNIANNLEKTVVFFDSICYTTLWRQIEAQKISTNSDIVLVVGDSTSSNSLKLLDTCKANCQKSYLIENVSDLRSVQIDKNYEVLGIVSAASAPKELIMEVFYIMNELNTTEQNVEETVAQTETVAPAKENNANDEVSTMAEAMKKFSNKTYREGMRITAKIVSVDPTGISVAIEGGGKNDSGFITKEEAEIDGSFDPANYKVGDELKCVIIPKEPGTKSSAINLSKKVYDLAKLDDERVVRILAGEEFTLSNMQEVKGGLLGKIGTYTVFVPASQIRLGFVKNLADYTNKTLRLVALPPKEELDEDGNPKKRNNKRIVASQRVILEKEREEKDEEFWAGIYEGAIVNGKVKRFTDFGAFVSLKYMDGLVHCTDLSWSKKRVSDPSEVLELNKNYDFIVLSFDREKKKISLGYKQLQKKPYEIAQEKYPVGTVLTGKVARLVKFGAFIELEPGIDGLVHVSQIKNGWIENAAEVLKEGDEVQVKVMGYDNEKITLSIKELLPAEETPAVEADEKNEEAPRAKKEEKGGKARKAKEVKEDDEEPRQYVSETGGAKIGDIFKNLSVASDETGDSDK